MVRRGARARGAAGYGGLVVGAAVRCCRCYGARRTAWRRRARVVALPRPFPPQEAEGVHQARFDETADQNALGRQSLIGQAHGQEGMTDEAVATASCTAIKRGANEPMPLVRRGLIGGVGGDAEG